MMITDDNHVIFLPVFFSNTNTKSPEIVLFLNFSGVVRTGKHGIVVLALCEP